MARSEALATPKLLEWARRMAGYTVEESARRAGVPAKRVEEWEQGESRPTLGQLRDLADFYKRPLGLFYLEEPPPDDPLPTDFRRLVPERSETISPELRLVIRSARARREAALELFQDAGETPPLFNVAARLDEDPEKVASRLRHALTGNGSAPSGDSRTAFNYWRETAERGGVLVFQADRVETEEMRGLCLSEKPLPAMVLNTKDAYAARSFSLFHELTHIMLGQNGLCDLEESEAGHKRIEIFCNHVAGAALMPAGDLLGQPETPHSLVPAVADEVIASLARRFGASREAVVRRLVILHRVPMEFYRRKRRQLRHEYETLPRQKKTGFASPPTLAVARAGPFFTRLVLEAFDEERVTASDVAGLLGMQLKHLDRVRRALQPKIEGNDNGP